MRDRDETVRKITDCIIRNSKVSVDAIATMTELPASTLNHFMMELQQEGQIERVIRIRDWSAAGYPLVYRVDVVVCQAALSIKRGGPQDDDQEIGTPQQLSRYIRDILTKEYRGRVNVESVVILLGSQADLSLMVRASDKGAITQFVLSGLRELRGVQSLFVSEVVWSTDDNSL